MGLFEPETLVGLEKAKSKLKKHNVTVQELCSFVITLSKMSEEHRRLVQKEETAMNPIGSRTLLSMYLAHRRLCKKGVLSDK